MSAIEMMDPKMDAGMIGNQVNRKILNFEQAIKVSRSSIANIYRIKCNLFYDFVIGVEGKL